MRASRELVARTRRTARSGLAQQDQCTQQVYQSTVHAPCCAAAGRPEVVVWGLQRLAALGPGASRRPELAALSPCVTYSQRPADGSLEAGREPPRPASLKPSVGATHRQCYERQRGQPALESPPATTTARRGRGQQAVQAAGGLAGRLLAPPACTVQRTRAQASCYGYSRSGL